MAAGLHPGTDTIAFSGRRPRTDAFFTSYGDQQDELQPPALDCRLNIDARTCRPSGALRAFFRYELTNGAALLQHRQPLGGNQGIIAQVGPATSLQLGFIRRHQLDLAFVQFGPIHR